MPTNETGTWLRRTREAHGLTIEDLARSTKISKTILTAIETGDVLHLPAAIYTRGFVKAYAREVGLDPDRTANEYLAQIQSVTTEHLLGDDGQLPPLARPADTAVDANDDARHMLAANQMRRVGWLTTVLAAVGLIVYLVSFGDGDGGGNAAGATAADVAGSDGLAANQMTPETGGLTPDAAKAAGAPLRLELSTQGLCWLVISVDGEPVLARLLQPGERHAFDVENEAVMRVGDPAALTLSINGEPGRPLGSAGEPVDVRITKANFHQFLSS